MGSFKGENKLEARGDHIEMGIVSECSNNIMMETFKRTDYVQVPIEIPWLMLHLKVTQWSVTQFNEMFCM